MDITDTMKCHTQHTATGFLMFEGETGGMTWKGICCSLKHNMLGERDQEGDRQEVSRPGERGLLGHTAT